MNLDLITSLQTDFGRLYDENFKLRSKEIYNKEIDAFRKRLEEVGISSKLSPKEIELKLQQIYETLMKGPTKTTLNAAESADFIKEAEKRDAAIKQTQVNQTKAVEDFITKNQERIAKAQSVQDKLKDKIVYAEVVIPEIPKLTDIEQQDLETLKKYAKDETPPKNGGLTPKQILINDLTTKIEEILGPDLKNLPEEDKKIVAQTYAVKIVDEIAKPVVDYSFPIQTAILTAIPKDIDSKKSIIQKTVPENPLLKQAREGSVAMEIEVRNQFYTPKEIAKRLLGPLSTHIYGASPEEIQVTFVENKSDSQATHMVDLGELNQKYIQVLKEQDVFINKVKEIGFNKIQTVFAVEARTFLANKVIKSPVGILISKDPVINSIFTRYALSERVVWQTVGQSKFVGLVMKIAPDTAGPLLGLAGKALGKEFVKPIVGLATKEIAGQVAGKVATDVGVKVATGTGLAATITAAFAWTGPLAPVIGAIGAFIGTSIIGEGISNLFSKLKVWWTNNKDVAGPAVAIGLGFGGLVLGGPAVGGLVLLGGLAATGSLATFATGAFGVLGFIGRSVGIAIATPVIVTLLVLPPLVAFIMLVINNSAYVVPPDAKSLGLNVDNPYILVTKVASPDKFANPTSGKVTVTYTVTIKALKSALSNLSITETKCTVSKKNASTILQCPPELENVPALPADLTISPTSSYSFTFTSEFDSKYADSAIFDTIKIKGDSVEEAGIETSGSESVCIGDCPHGCFEISNNNETWPSGFGSTLENATQELTSRFPNFVDKACSEGKTVNLCYTTKDPSPIGAGLCNQTIYAIHKHTDNCDINFNQCSLDGGPKDAFFLLTHELTHHVEDIDGSIINRYRNFGAPNELPLCSYSGTNGDNSEGAAEANALYANGGTAGFSTCSMNFVSQYPKNFMFAKDYMNNP